MELDSKPARQLNLDALRILACFMVVLMHVAYQDWGNLDGNALAHSTYDSLARSAVPLFFMISGALFLGKERGPSLSKLYTSNILKLLVIYIFWTVFYAVVGTLESQAFAAQNWQEVQALLNEQVFSPKYHLWFLPTMIIVYVAMPALYAIAHYEKGRYLLYCCVAFLALSVASHSSGFIPNLSSDIPGIIGRATARLIGYSGYFLLGYYLSVKEFPRIGVVHLLLALFLVLAVNAVAAQLYAINVESPARLLIANFSLPIVVEAALIFTIFVKLGPIMQKRLRPRTSRLITTVSAASLAIYVLHPFVIDHTIKLVGYDALILTPWLTVPLVALSIFLLCLLMGLVLRKIPFVNKWIV